MNVNESVIGEKGAQERGEKAEEAGTVVEKGLGEERWWVTSPLAERTNRFRVCRLCFLSVGEEGVETGQVRGKRKRAVAIGRDEKSMKRRVGEDKGGRTRTEMCISEEQWSDRASSTGERERERSFYYRERLQPRISYVLIKFRLSSIHPVRICLHPLLLLLTAAFC